MTLSSRIAGRDGLAVWYHHLRLLGQVEVRAAVSYHTRCLAYSSQVGSSTLRRRNRRKIPSAINATPTTPPICGQRC